jgi:galactitol-specific phosphotransferase system IIC component
LVRKILFGSACSDKLKLLIATQYYDIFMAIAEEIGYDATGKQTQNNELDFIGQELSKFISQLEN